jgi:hypothetical protein
MVFINGIKLDKVIEVLKKALPIIDNHRKSYEIFNNDRDHDQPIDAAMLATNKYVDDINEIVSSFESINKSTLYFPMYIDALAMKQALEDDVGENNVEFIPMWNNPDDETDQMDNPPDYYILKFVIERMAMDGNGYHVGWERCSYAAKTIKKSELKLSGIPRNMSPHVILPDSFEIIQMIHPDEEYPTIDSHESNCAIHNELPKDHDWNEDPYPDECDCGCNDEWNGYFPPDDEFWYSELDGLMHRIFHYNNLPDAVFNKDDGTWSIGDQVTWQVGDPEFVWID